MNNKIGILLLAVVLVFTVSIQAFGGALLEKWDIETSGSLDFYSHYVWRGFTLDTDPVLQPGINVAGYGFTISFWASFDLDNDDAAASDEVDYVIDYTHEFETFTLSVGHTSYTFPELALVSREMYVGASMPEILFSPTLTIYVDYGDEAQGGGDGTYITVGGSKGFTLMDDPGVTLDISLTAGFNNELFIAGTGTDLLINIGLTVQLTEDLTVTPSFNYAMPLGDLEDPADGNQENRFYAGLGLSYDF